MTATIDEALISRELGPDILRAAKEGRARDVLVLLLTDHMDVMLTPEGALFAAGLAVMIRRESFRDLLASKYGIFLAGRLPAPGGARKDG